MPFIPTTEVIQGSQFSGCHVGKSGTQDIGNGAGTPLTFDVEHFDTDGYFNPASNTRLTVPWNGYYYLWAVVDWNAGGTTTRRLARLTVNSGEIAIGMESATNTNNFYRYNLSGVRKLNAGDFVGVNAFMQLAGDQLVTSNCELGIVRLGFV